MNRYSLTNNGRILGPVHLTLGKALEAAAEAILSGGVAGISIVIWSHYKPNLDSEEEVIPVLVLRDVDDSEGSVDNVRE